MCSRWSPAVLSVLLLAPQSLLAQQTTAQIVESVSPAVVTINFEGDDGAGLGSGFIVDPSGIIVTNYHVIDDARSAAVKLPNGDIYNDVDILATDERRDLAILSINGFGLPVVEFGNSDSVVVGTEVVAIGSPRGLENTVSTGVVSGRRQLEGYSLLQISAPISPGSSGGPILNHSGAVVAVAVSGIEDGQNLNFAVPINYARGLLASVDDSPTSELRPLALSDEGTFESEAERVNDWMRLFPASFRDFSYEFETDLGNGQKMREKVDYRIIETGDSTWVIERVTEGETKWKSAPLAKSQTIGRHQMRASASAETLEPIAFYFSTEWYDGRSWKSGQCSVEFKNLRARGQCISTDDRRDIDRRLPEGIVLDQMGFLAIQPLIADPAHPNTLVGTGYDPIRDSIDKTTYNFKGQRKVGEMNRDFQVQEVEIIYGAGMAEVMYDLNFPHYLIRSEASGRKGKIKKIH